MSFSTRMDGGRCSSFSTVVLACGSLLAHLFCLNALAQSLPETHITPWFGSTTGTVVNEMGKPLEDVLVTFYGSQQLDRTLPNWYQTSTDKNGQYRFPDDAGIRASLANVMFVHPDYALKSMTVSDGNHRKVVLVKGQTLKGRVIDPDGNAVPDTFVSLLNYNTLPEWLKRWATTTDENGEFEIKNAPANDPISVTLRKPGVVWESVTWYSKDSELPERDFPKNVRVNGESKVVQGDFTFQTSGKFKVTIDVRNKETDQPVRPGRLGCRHDYRDPPPFKAFMLDYLIEGDTENSPAFSNIQYGIYQFACLPEEGSDLLGAVFKATFKKGVPDLEKVVHLTPGIRIKGIIRCSKTSAAIPRVSLQWFPDNAEEFEKLGIIPQYGVRSDKEGNFEILVPPVAGEIRMVGPVFGFITINSATPMTDSLRSRFSLKIPVDPKPVSDAKLSLEPAAKIRFRAVDEDGKPVVAAFWASTHHRTHGRRRFECGNTDENGSFTTHQMFDDATYDYEQSDEPSNRRGVTINRNQVFCWDQNAVLSGFAIIETDAIKSGDEILVTLKPAQTITGQLVDHMTRRPICNTMVSATAAQVAGLSMRWLTETDDEGNFELTGLFPDSYFRLRPSVHIEKSFQTANMKTPQQLGVLEAIQVEKLVAAPDISKLTKEDAVSKLVQFANSRISKAPARQQKNGWNAGEPRQRFLNNLTKSFNKPMALLLDGNDDVDFCCQTCIRMLNTVSESDFGTIAQSAWTYKARDFLIENIDRDGVFEAYKRLQWQTSSSMYPSAIFKNSEKKEIRVWAYRKLLSGKLNQFVSACKRLEDNEEGLARQLARMEEFWNTGLTEFSDIAEPGGGLLSTRVLRLIDQTIDRLVEKGASDAVIEKVNELKYKLDPANKH